MEKEEEEVSSEPARLALGFIAMAGHEKLLELILRYETGYSRLHDRAMKELFRLREELNLRNDPKPGPDPPAIAPLNDSAHPTSAIPPNPAVLPLTYTPNPTRNGSPLIRIVLFPTMRHQAKTPRKRATGGSGGKAGKRRKIDLK